MRTHTCRIPALALVALLGACGLLTSTEGEDEEIVLFEVAPERVDCVGEMQGRCIRVREPGEEEWRTFYGEIEGFQHEEGFTYVLRVARREIENPPADGSSLAYRLLEVVSREPGSG